MMQEGSHGTPNGINPELRPFEAPPEAPWRSKEFFQYWLFCVSLFVPAMLAIDFARSRPLEAFFVDLVLYGFGVSALLTFTGPRMMKQPRRYPVAPELTEKAVEFAKRLARPPCIVHEDQYGPGVYSDYAFREGRDILVSEHLLATATRGQIDFILARLCSSKTWYRPWQRWLAGPATFALGLAAVRWRPAFPLLLIALGAVICGGVLALVRSMRPRATREDLMALELTQDLESAVTSVQLLPILGRAMARAPESVWGIRAELRRHWDECRPRFEV